MSLALQGRGMFSGILEAMGISRCRTLDCSGSTGKLHSPFPLSSSVVIYSDPPSELFPLRCQGVSSSCCSRRLIVQRCISRPRILQSPFRYTEGHRWLEACYRSVLPQSLCSAVSFPHGNSPVGPPIHPPWRLDDFSRSSRRLPPGSCPSGVSEVSAFLSGRQGLPISGSVLWIIIRTSSLHSCHGPGLLHHASFWVPDSALFGRLVGPWILPSGDRTGEGLPSCALLGAWDIDQPIQELPHSISE